MEPTAEQSDRVLLRNILLGTSAMLDACQHIPVLQGIAMVRAYATELRRTLAVHLQDDPPSEASIREATFGLLEV